MDKAKVIHAVDPELITERLISLLMLENHFGIWRKLSLEGKTK